MLRVRRQEAIARLLATHLVERQLELIELLDKEGYHATQATISRDLDEIGAVKLRVPGRPRPVYQVPELPREQLAPAEHLRRVVRAWAVDVAVSMSLVVLRTPPGCAHVVASALDRAGLPETLGTVAGDDTLLVVASTARAASRLEAELRAMLDPTTAR